MKYTGTSQIESYGCSISQRHNTDTGNLDIDIGLGAKNDFSWLGPPAKGKSTAQWAPKWQNKTAGGSPARGEPALRVGVNNGDVTAARCMTERQDNGLLSVLRPHSSIPLSALLGGENFSSCFIAKLLRQRGQIKDSRSTGFFGGSTSSGAFYFQETR